MPEYADLELGLGQREAGRYSVELRFSQPGSEAELRLSPGGASPVSFDFDHLRLQALDPEAYGKVLSESLFADPEVRVGFAQARGTAQSLDVPLRLRLFIGPDAPELHSLRWETLREPDDDSRLFTDERILCSRYLSSRDWHAERRMG